MDLSKFCSIYHTAADHQVYQVKVLSLTQPQKSHFGDVLPSQFLGLVLKKLNLLQQQQTYTGNIKIL